jgi:DNA polymerase
MAWSERQQAMLQARGLRVWGPPAGEVEEAPPPLPAAALAEPAPAAVIRPAGTVLSGLDWPALGAAVAACRACSLCEGRRHTVFGTGHPHAHWMIVGEAPGEQEDLRGEPFVGPAGQLLDQMLAALGLTRAEGPAAIQVFITNTLKCRPPANRNPSPEELAECQPFLERQIALVQPRIILAMGRFAALALLGSDAPLGRLRGQVHSAHGLPVVVTYHPAYLLRQPAEKAKAWEDLCLAASVIEAEAAPPA